MKRCISRLLALLLLVFAVGAWGLAADNFKPEEGYVSLFNGKDLTGWEYGAVPPVKNPPPREKLDGKTASREDVFSVKDGLLVASGKRISALYTSREFNKDFRIKFEFRTVADKPKNNSGLFLHGQQLQLDATNEGGLTGVFKNIKGFKVGDWNEIDVTVKGGVKVITINGKAVTDRDTLELTVKDGKPAARLNGEKVDVDKFDVFVGAEATCLCNGEEISKKPMLIPATGTIGLQSEYGQFEFRRIRIKEM